MALPMPKTFFPSSRVDWKRNLVLVAYYHDSQVRQHLSFNHVPFWLGQWNQSAVCQRWWWSPEYSSCVTVSMSKDELLSDGSMVLVASRIQSARDHSEFLHTVVVVRQRSTAWIYDPAYHVVKGQADTRLKNFPGFWNVFWLLVIILNLLFPTTNVEIEEEENDRKKHFHHRRRRCKQ